MERSHILRTEADMGEKRRPMSAVSPAVELYECERHIRTAWMIVRAIRHQLRRDIIMLIDRYGSMNVTDIQIRLRCEQCVVSQHLAILRDAGIVQARRDGKGKIYSLNEDQIIMLTAVLDTIQRSHDYMKKRKKKKS